MQAKSGPPSDGQAQKADEDTVKESPVAEASSPVSGASTQAAATSEPLGWTVGAVIAYSTAPSSIKDDMKAGLLYGLLIRKAVPAWVPGLSLGGMISQQTHTRAKDSHVNGDVTIQSLRLGASYELAPRESSAVVIHAGLIRHSWSGEATYKPNGENNQDSGSDFGRYTSLGYRWTLGSQVHIEPRLEINAASASLDGWMGVMAVDLNWSF
jgi:hypothetical protein